MSNAQLAAIAIAAWVAAAFAAACCWHRIAKAHKNKKPRNGGEQ